MIKKSVFEDELIAGMQVKLAEVQSGQETDNLTEAVEHLNSAAQIFDDHGNIVTANKIMNILYKIAECGHQHKHRPDKVPNGDRHVKNLSPEKQLKNLMHHGHQFNLSDDGLLNAEFDENNVIEVSDDESFEDEK